MTSQEVYDMIIGRLAAKQPFSLVRWGDGESILLNGNADRVRLERHLIRHLGYVPPDPLIDVIRHDLMTAAANCTVLGIEITHAQKKRGGGWAKTAAVLDKYVPTRVAVGTCSSDMHYNMLNDGLWDRLLMGRETVYYVAARDVTEGFRRKFGIKNVHCMFIQGQAKYELPPFVPVHFPKQYRKVAPWIRQQGDLTGQLCLVGAGYVGKIYLEWFRQQGGVAVDVGSIFDLWYGKLTRGKGRGPTATVDTYKLLK